MTTQILIEFTSLEKAPLDFINEIATLIQINKARGNVREVGMAVGEFEAKNCTYLIYEGEEHAGEESTNK